MDTVAASELQTLLLAKRHRLCTERRFGLRQSDSREQDTFAPKSVGEDGQANDSG